MPEITRQMIARAYTDAAKVLLEGNFEDETCCGVELDERGQCVYRPGHPTSAHVAITDYPEAYSGKGKFHRRS